MDKVAAAIALLSVRGVGPVRIRKFLDSIQSAERAFSDVVQCKDMSLLQNVGLKAPLDDEVLSDAGRSAEALRRDGIDSVVWGDSQYNDSTHGSRKTLLPPILFVRGDISRLQKKSVGISGSRNVSDEGVIAAHGIVSQLVEAGVHIVSGGARGVDTAGHIVACV